MKPTKTCQISRNPHNNLNLKYLGSRSTQKQEAITNTRRWSET